MSFKMHKIIFFSRKPEKISRFHQQIEVGSIYPKHRYFFYLTFFHIACAQVPPFNVHGDEYSEWG